MKLSEALAFLDAADARIFGEIYKQLEFKDDSELREYLDLVLHEPVEWLKAFPAKWKSEGNFNKVRGAFRKLMRARALIDAYGSAFCEHVRDTVLQTFKSHLAAVIADRNKSAAAAAPPKNVIEHMAADGASEDGSQLEAESICSVKMHRRPLHNHAQNSVMTFPLLVTVQDAMDSAESVWEKKYRVLEAAYEALVAPSPPPQTIEGTNIVPWGEGSRPEERLRNSAYILMKALSKF